MVEPGPLAAARPARGRCRASSAACARRGPRRGGPPPRLGRGPPRRAAARNRATASVACAAASLHRLDELGGLTRLGARLGLAHGGADEVVDAGDCLSAVSRWSSETGRSGRPVSPAIASRASVGMPSRRAWSAAPRCDQGAYSRARTPNRPPPSIDTIDSGSHACSTSASSPKSARSISPSTMPRSMRSSAARSSSVNASSAARWRRSIAIRAARPSVVRALHCAVDGVVAHLRPPRRIGAEEVDEQLDHGGLERAAGSGRPSARCVRVSAGDAVSGIDPPGCPSARWWAAIVRWHPSRTTGRGPVRRVETMPVQRVGVRRGDWASDAARPARAVVAVPLALG